MQKWKVYRHKRRRLIMYVSEKYVGSLNELNAALEIPLRLYGVGADAIQGSYYKIAGLLSKNYKVLAVGALISLVITAANNLYVQNKATDPKMAATKSQRFVKGMESKCSQSKDPAKCKEKLGLLSKKWDAKKKAIQAQP